jgi:hypothetical protein
MPSVIDIINYAKICQYIAQYDRGKKLLFTNGNVPTQNLSDLIYQVRKSIEFQYNKYQYSANLIPNSNYLYNLCNRYIAKAIEIYNGGGGGVIVNPSLDGIYVYAELVLIVNGGTGQPLVNTSTYQNDILKNARYLSELTINKQVFYIKDANNLNGDYEFNYVTGTIQFVNYIWNTDDVAVLNFERLKKI